MLVVMTPSGTASGASKHVQYEIVVHGELSDHFTSTFLRDSLESTVGKVHFEPGDGSTAIVIEVTDQAHLLAILERLRDLSLEIERVNPTDESERTTR